MREIFYDYVEREPAELFNAPEITVEERQLLADSLTNERARFVVSAVRSELHTRREAALDQAADLTSRLSVVRTELGIMNKVLGEEASTESQHKLFEEQVVERYNYLKSLDTKTFLEEIKDEPGFDLTLVTNRDKKYAWTDSNSDKIERLFGYDDKKVFSRAINSLSRSNGYVSYLEEEGIVSESNFRDFGQLGGNTFRRLQSLRVEKPEEFLKYAVNEVPNFGPKCAPAIIAIAQLQQQSLS